MKIEEKYLMWLNHPQMDDDLKEELQNMNEQQKKDAFYIDAQFGTAGIRNILGAGTNRLNVYTIRKATKGVAEVLKQKGGNLSVAIAYDNRYKSAEFAMQTAKILASYNIRVYLYDSLRTTPQLSFTVRYLHCTAGIMITASHNTKEYNGYKIYDENGCQLVPIKVAPIIKAIADIEEDFVEEAVLNEQQQKLITYISADVDKIYLDEVLTVQLNPDLSKDNFKIVYTSQHGTSYKPISTLFAKVGYDTVYVKEQCYPDPAFTNTIIPNPEDPRAYVLALEYARKNDADVVLTTDPDGDRLGLAVKQGNEYILMTGNQTGAVLIDYVLSMHKEKGTLPKNAVLFNTIVTSDLGEAIAHDYGVDVEKTLTGFKYIGDKIEMHNQKKDKKFIFGYEESYGYLIKDFVRDKDANQSCLLIAECANYYKKKGLTLYDVLQKLYQKYGTYAESQKSIEFAGADGSIKMQNLLAKLRKEQPQNIAGCAVVKYQDFGTQKCYENGNVEDIVGFDKSDVLKYFLADGSWIAVRPSGTEPKCKFYYCIKGKDAKDVQTKQQLYYKAVTELI
ncbi:MAG: phospho-sugar mutase [Erysipelotrichia bacterium]|nr:phospho-sugar mutase [Erysipelotrichia bacterium]